MTMNRKCTSFRAINGAHEPYIEGTPRSTMTWTVCRLCGQKEPRGPGLFNTAAPAQSAAPAAWICENSTIGPDEDKHTIDWYGADVDALPVGTKLYAAPLPAQTERPHNG